MANKCLDNFTIKKHLNQFFWLNFLGQLSPIEQLTHNSENYSLIHVLSKDILASSLVYCNAYLANFNIKDHVTGISKKFKRSFVAGAVLWKYLQYTFIVKP